MSPNKFLLLLLVVIVSVYSYFTRRSSVPSAPEKPDQADSAKREGEPALVKDFAASLNSNPQVLQNAAQNMGGNAENLGTPSIFARQPASLTETSGEYQQINTPPEGYEIDPVTGVLKQIHAGSEEERNNPPVYHSSSNPPPGFAVDPSTGEVKAEALLMQENAAPPVYAQIHQMPEGVVSNPQFNANSSQDQQSEYRQVSEPPLGVFFPNQIK